MSLVATSFAILLVICISQVCSMRLHVCRKDVADASVKQLVASVGLNFWSTNELNSNEVPVSILNPSSWWHVKVPSPLSLFYNGEFTVYYPQYIARTLREAELSSDSSDPGLSFTFNDIYIGRRKSWAMNAVCSRLVDSFLFPFLCSGELQNEASDSTLEDPRLRSYQFERTPCTDRSISMGYCSFIVDPMSDVCVYVDARLITDQCSAAEDDSTETCGAVYQSDYLIDYKTVSFTLLDVWHSFMHFRTGGKQQKMPSRSKTPKEPIQITQLRDLKGRSWRRQFQHAVKTDLASYATETLEVVSDVSIYLCCLVLGYLIISNSSDLADNTLMQLIMQILAGLLLSLLFISFWFYRLTRETVDRFGGPISRIAQIPLSITMLSVTWRNPRMLLVLLQALLQFWDTGYPFGVWWLGKVYFLTCIAASITACRYFDFFQPDSTSTSWQVLQYAVKGLGLLFLSSSTSNSTVSYLLVLVGLFYDNLSYFSWYAWIRISGLVKKPTYKYIGKKMTEDEVKVLSAKKTRQALSELQVYLHNHPIELEVTSDKMREAGRRDEAYLLRRFARGAYPGVPYTVNEQLDASPLSISFRQVVIIGMVLTLSVGIIVVTTALYLRLFSIGRDGDM